ncbi:MAG: c-type cytochrome [Thermoanaerobaculales bacterium]|jgi:cytochrome c2|nr:c-type cytochrome [Thermoanaerobaculales bacterium]
MRAATLVVTATLIIFAAACGAGKDEFRQQEIDLTGAPPGVAYAALNCDRCHGAELEGQRTAPKLTGLSKRWSENELIAYLRDPKAVQAATPRLAYMAEKYPIEMPAYAHTDEEVLRGLVGWLLAQ